MNTVAKNQHYVWRHYLSAWTNGGQIWCVRWPSKIAFRANPRKVGSETFFYRFHELDADDLAYLDGIIAQLNSQGLEDINREWVELFQRAFTIKQKWGAGVLQLLSGRRSIARSTRSRRR